MSRRVCLVVNPRAGAGRTGDRSTEIHDAARRALGDVEMRITERPGHASELARAAALDGFRMVVAVGGDGTANEVVNGLIVDGEPVAPGVVFGLVNGGTGGDLAKALRMPSGLDESFAVLARAEPSPVDVLDVHLTGHDGAAVRRACINVTGFGMNGVVVKRANESSKRWGGRATFIGATARTILDYRPAPVRVTWTAADGSTGAWEGPLSSAFVANGEYCGGGMWVGRGGALGDGLVDVTIIPELPLPRLVLGAPRLFTGTMDRVRGVERIAVRSLEALALDASAILVDVDGEQPGKLPLRASVLPSILLLAS
jgi:diacylglycerol kinase (ATP)